MKYVLAIDQSTQSTKAFLVDCNGNIVNRSALPHKQIVDENGYVSHDPEEIFANLKKVVALCCKGAEKDVVACGITNQRETACVWDEKGVPLVNAIVWQCGRAKGIADNLIDEGLYSYARKTTGLMLSPYYSAAKFTWFVQNSAAVRKACADGTVHFGTMDSFLVYRLTGNFYTDVTNASRTQLMNISTLSWDETMCAKFGLDRAWLPQIMSSDDCFGETDFDGVLPQKIRILSVMGDSHAAFYAQDRREKGQTKITYGTGSSVMCNLGELPLIVNNGIVTSVGFKENGKVVYVSEGNINYAGALVSWLKDGLGIISSPEETSDLAFAADQADTTCIVPAFSGLSSPYCNNNAKALICGMTRNTGKKEIVKAALDAIAFQVCDIVTVMNEQLSGGVADIRVDGEITRNKYLTNFQSAILAKSLSTTDETALSAIGVALMAGRKCGLYDYERSYVSVTNEITGFMSDEQRNRKLKIWHQAVQLCTGKK